MDDDEAGWLERARRDPADCQPIFAEYAEDVRRLLEALVGDRALSCNLADDVFQRAMTSGWGCRADEVPLRSWLYGIALAVARWHLAQRDRECQRELGDPPPVAPVDDARQSDDSTRERRVQTELARMSVADRELLCLHYWGSLSASEIALLQGCPIERIEWRLERARHRLSQVLARA